MTVRVRFAPSPTGTLHLGSARTALFNWLFARHEGGVFILRLEDTDRERSKKEFEEDILSSMKWLGFDYDEGPDVGGNFGSYRQSERNDLYQEKAKKLLETSQAYLCFCTPAELETERKQAEANKQAPVYSGKCCNLTPEQIKKFQSEGKKAALRFRVPAKEIIVHDLIRGEVRFDTSLIGDFIILKSDDTATYNFAVVIDDLTMKITHVIRGEDHLSNTPKQILIYEALGESLPQFAHLPMILGPDRSKLSKRHGAKSVNEYKEEGYLAGALVNFLALLSWSDPDGKDILEVEEMVKKFTLDRVGKSGAVFDVNKLNHINSLAIRRLTQAELLRLVKPYLDLAKLDPGQIPPSNLAQIVKIVQEQMVVLPDFLTKGGIFFPVPVEYSEEGKDILLKPDSRKAIENIQRQIKDLNEITTAQAQQILEQLLVQTGLGKGKAYPALRSALVGSPRGPVLEDIILALGLAETKKRLSAAMKYV